ncbi:TPA: hypothetical protein ACLGN2_004798, partial [Salmonella enterica]
QLWLTTLPLSEDKGGAGLMSGGQSGITILSDEECHFLDSWQPGLFPPSVDAGFIYGLKTRRKNNGSVALRIRRAIKSGLRSLSGNQQTELVCA